MQKLVLLVRQLRRIAAFKVSTRAIVIILMILGVWVATKKLDFQPEVNDKLIHVVVFFGFTVLVDVASSKKPFWLWKGLPLLGYGIGVEVMQYFTPSRSFSIMDMVADFSGILIYFLLKIAVLNILKRNSEYDKFK